MGLQGMIGEMVMRCDQDLSGTRRPRMAALQGHTEAAWRALAQADHRAGERPADAGFKAAARGRRGPKKSARAGHHRHRRRRQELLTDELIRRLRLDQDDRCASP
jgi:methylmalonyl-CoA mutase